MKTSQTNVTMDAAVAGFTTNIWVRGGAQMVTETTCVAGEHVHVVDTVWEEPTQCTDSMKGNTHCG